MPNEPCGDDVCIDRAELEGLHKAAHELELLSADRAVLVYDRAQALMERDEARKSCEMFLEGLRKTIKERDEAVLAVAGMRGAIEAGLLRSCEIWHKAMAAERRNADIDGNEDLRDFWHGQALRANIRRQTLAEILGLLSGDPADERYYDRLQAWEKGHLDLIETGEPHA